MTPKNSAEAQSESATAVAVVSKFPPPPVVAAVSDRWSTNAPDSHRAHPHWGCGRPRPHKRPAKHGLHICRHLKALSSRHLATHPYSSTFALQPSSVAEPHSSPSTLLVSGVHCVSVCTNPSTSRLASTSLIPTNVPGVE